MYQVIGVRSGVDDPPSVSHGDPVLEALMTDSDITAVRIRRVNEEQIYGKAAYDRFAQGQTMPAWEDLTGAQRQVWKDTAGAAVDMFRGLMGV